MILPLGSLIQYITLWTKYQIHHVCASEYRKLLIADFLNVTFVDLVPWILMGAHVQFIGGVCMYCAHRVCLA